jgi:hypothetical protein
MILGPLAGACWQFANIVGRAQHATHPSNPIYQQQPAPDTNTHHLQHTHTLRHAAKCHRLHKGMGRAAHVVVCTPAFRACVREDGRERRKKQTDQAKLCGVGVCVCVGGLVTCDPCEQRLVNVVRVVKVPLDISVGRRGGVKRKEGGMCVCVESEEGESLSISHRFRISCEMGRTDAMATRPC